MDKMWGSTCSLGGLLADSLLCEGGDNFLEDLPNFPGAKSGEFMPDIAACSGSNSMDSSASGDTGIGAPDAISALFTNSCAPASLPLTINSALLPTDAALNRAWPSSVKADVKAELASNMDAAVNAANLQLLQQLLGGIQTGAITLPPPPPPPPPAQVAANLLSQLAALKPAAPVVPKPVFAPVSNAGPTAPVVPEIPAAPVSQPVSLPPSLPGLNEQQQEALRSLVMGQLGTTSEGKKVRRMLSNRESARRSRHRKQAHMQTLEQKSSEMENENLRLKEALARAATQELKAMEERTRLYTEIAELRDKCARLEASAANCKATSKASEQSAKKGLSHSSSADGCSDDSCDSVPAKRRVASDSEEEGACKRCRRCEAKAH